MLTKTAKQRENVIRDAKFPRKAMVIPYSQARRFIGGFIQDKSRDLKDLDREASRFYTKHRSEEEGWQKAEYKRNATAIETFATAFTRTRAKKYQFEAPTSALTQTVAGVQINVRLDASIIEIGDDGQAFTGGCVLFFASGEQSRKDLEDRLKTTAAIIHWTLESIGGNIEPLDRLCIAFDVFGQQIVKAPKGFDRLRANLVTSCREAASSWDSVAPPEGYDGPDWA